MKEFFISNSENIEFLIFCIIHFIVPLFILFLLFVLISRKSDKSRKEKLHAISSCIGDILTTSLLCGCMFFFGFAFREQIFLEDPDWNNDMWQLSYILLGTAFSVYCNMLLVIFYIPLRIMIKHIKRG